jgi:Zn-finger nucleic acid-binding protein
MNFISEMGDQEMHVELKYCERCGGLWLRLQGTDGVHCASCRAHLAARPQPGEPTPCKARRRRRVHVREEETDVRKDAQENVRGEDFQNPGRVDCLEGMAATEVWG